MKLFHPDGIDLQPSLSQQVWKGKYDFKSSADLIKTVTCKINEMYFVENILMYNCRQDIPVSACFSHEYIYGFIQEQFSTSEAEKLEIVNVDFHADYYNDNVKNDTQDCGNRCYFIKQEIPCTKVTWIAPENYKELYEEKDYTEPRDYPKEPTFGIESEKDLEKDSELASALATLKVV